MNRFFVCVVALAAFLLSTGQGFAAPPPPPPGPPEGLPDSYDGYETQALWSAYQTWVRRETHVRREAAFEALSLPRYSADPDAWRTRLAGPGYRSESWWIPHGGLFAFEQICPPGAPGDGDEGCLWRYRSAFFDAREADINTIVAETFDGSAFAAFLRRSGTAPEAMADSSPAIDGDFEPAMQARARLDALVVTRDVREDVCPAVGAVIAGLAETSVPLTASGPPEGAPPPPPPLPPGADIETLTLPLGIYPDAEAVLTITGRGAGSMQALLQQLVGPVRDCFEASAD